MAIISGLKNKFLQSPAKLTENIGNNGWNLHGYSSREGRVA